MNSVVPTTVRYWRTLLSRPHGLAALVRRQPPLSSRYFCFRSTSTKTTQISQTTPDEKASTDLAKAASSLVRTPGTVQILGFAGAIPFLAGAIATTITSDPMPFARATQLYGASILSFLGGIHWGVALRSAVHGVSGTRDYIYGVIPSLVAWSAALMPPPEGLFVLTSSFGLAFLYDMFRFGQRSAVPSWYRRLRVPLSIAAAGGCCVSFVAVRRDLDEPGVCPRDKDTLILSTSTIEGQITT